MHVTTINGKGAADLKENKERVCGKVWREEREAEMMQSLYNLKRKEIHRKENAWTFT